MTSKSWLVGALAAAAAACHGDGSGAVTEPNASPPDAAAAPDAFEQGAPWTADAASPADATPDVDAAPPDAAPAPDAAPDATPSPCPALDGLVEAPPTGALGDVWVGEQIVWTISHAVIGRRDEGRWCWYAPADELVFRRLLGLADDDLWIAGDAGALLHVDATGATRVDAGTTADLLAVWGTSGADLWIGGTGGTVLHFDGVTWQPRPLPIDHRVTAIGGSSQDVLVAASYAEQSIPDSTLMGQTATIYRWDDATATWSSQLESHIGYGASLLSRIDARSADDVWAVGHKQPPGSLCGGHQAWRYDGVSWTRVQVTPDDGCGTYGDVLVDDDAVWITDDRYPLHHYTDGAWTAHDAELTTGLYAIDRRGDRIFAVGTRWDGTYLPRVVRWLDGAWQSDL